MDRNAWPAAAQIRRRSTFGSVNQGLKVQRGLTNDNKDAKQNLPASWNREITKPSRKWRPSLDPGLGSDARPPLLVSACAMPNRTAIRRLAFKLRCGVLRARSPRRPQPAGCPRRPRKHGWSFALQPLRAPVLIYHHGYDVVGGRCCALIVLLGLFACARRPGREPARGRPSASRCSPFAGHTAGLRTRMYIQGRPPVTKPFSCRPIFIGLGGGVFAMTLDLVFSPYWRGPPRPGR